MGAILPRGDGRKFIETQASPPPHQEHAAGTMARMGVERCPCRSPSTVDYCTIPRQNGQVTDGFCQGERSAAMALQRAILADNRWREHQPPGTCVIAGKRSRSPASELRGDPLRGPCPRGTNSASAVATTRVISRTDLELPPLWNHERMGCDHARAACERITGLDSGWIPQATARPTSVQLMTSRPASIRVSPNE